MALKAKVTKEEFDALPDHLKGEYVEKDGAYHLDIDGAEDTGALKRAKDREAQRAKELEKELADIRAKMEDDATNNARKKGDLETLEKSWQSKLTAREAELQGIIEKRNAHITAQLVDNVALRIATEISDSPELILPHIKARLQANLDGEAPVTRVLDASGQISALTVEDLQKEFVANPKFSRIIIGSKATGSGASSNNGGGAPKSLNEMSESERTHLFRTNPDEFRRLSNNK